MHTSFQHENFREMNNGDPKTFNNLFKSLYSSLVQFARRIVIDKAVAEDIVTDVFVKLWQRHSNFSSAQSARSFLYISTRNACFNHLEQAQYQVRAKQALRYLLDDSEESVLSEITRAEVLRQVFYLVHELPPKCRRIMLMSFVNGYSNQEIAGKLLLSVHTVRNHKVRGMRMVRKKLKGFNRVCTIC